MLDLSLVGYSSIIILSRQSAILYHSAVQPCYCRVELHIQGLYIVRFFMSPACGGDRRNHAYSTDTCTVLKLYSNFLLFIIDQFTVCVVKNVGCFKYIPVVIRNLL